MTIKEKTITVESTEIEAIICDKCGREVLADDWIERKEFLNIDMISGYGSIFGDGTRISGNFCQYCVNELLGKFLRVEHPNDVVQWDGSCSANFRLDAVCETKIYSI